MRNKNIAAVLALFLGILGIHRFYLGQYLRGALHIIAPIVLLLLGLWIAELLGDEYYYWDVVRGIEIDFSRGNMDFSGANKWPLVALLSLLVVPLFDTIWFATRSTDRFNARYNRKPIPWAAETLKSVACLALSCFVVYLLFNKFLVVHKADVGATPDFTISSAQLAQEFAADEMAAHKKFNGKVLLMDGMITSIDSTSGTGERILFFEDASGYTISCPFQSDQGELISMLSVGQMADIKGRYVDVTNYEVHLEDCLLIRAGEVIEPSDIVPVDSMVSE